MALHPEAVKSNLVDILADLASFLLLMKNSFCSFATTSQVETAPIAPWAAWLCQNQAVVVFLAQVLVEMLDASGCRYVPLGTCRIRRNTNHNASNGTANNCLIQVLPNGGFELTGCFPVNVRKCCQSSPSTAVERAASFLLLRPEACGW